MKPRNTAVRLVDGKLLLQACNPGQGTQEQLVHGCQLQLHLLEHSCLTRSAIEHQLILGGITGLDIEVTMTRLQGLSRLAGKTSTPQQSLTNLNQTKLLKLLDPILLSSFDLKNFTSPP